jgi:hypothetical protein
MNRTIDANVATHIGTYSDAVEILSGKRILLLLYSAFTVLSASGSYVSCGVAHHGR